MKSKLIRKMVAAVLMIIEIFIMTITAYGDQVKQSYYFLYNSQAVTDKDLKSIKGYIEKFNKVDVQCILKDTSGMDEYEIYGYLKQQPKVDAIQIFGIAKDVPAFKVKHDIVMRSGVQEIARISTVWENSYYDTDYFYNNLQNDIEQIKEFTIKNYGYETIKVNLAPEIKVVRLPLTKGDYETYLNKYYSYVKMHPGVLPLTSFYDSAFGKHTQSIDHLNYFIQGNMDYEGKFIDSTKYTLFGQKEFYNMKLSTSGEYTKENMRKMNEKQIQNFVFSGHGTKDGFFYQTKSEINSKNVNTILEKNYYNMNAISCNNAEGIDNKNFVYKMLKGKGVYVMALTDFYYHGDLNFQKDMNYTYQDDNFRYLYYHYYKNLYSGINLTDSFHKAQKAYAERIHKKPIREISQCQLSNLVFCHNFGVLEYKQIEKQYTYKDLLNERQKNDFATYIQAITQEITEWTNRETLEKEKIKTMLNKEYTFSFGKFNGEDLYEVHDGIKINKMDYQRIGDEILVNIDFDSSQEGRIILRSNGPNVPLNDFKKGNNKLQFPIQLKYLFRFDASIDLFFYGYMNPKTKTIEGVKNHYISIKY
ncbi:MAG: hypothetical protein K0S71_1891 [Clostridia bacterium]|jgi:hypothetical protein|nr:hypothetical protein [Clostridia bacterium]